MFWGIAVKVPPANGGEWLRVKALCVFLYAGRCIGAIGLAFIESFGKKEVL